MCWTYYKGGHTIIKFKTEILGLLSVHVLIAQMAPAGEVAKGTKTYNQFEKSEACKSCHTDIYQQWTQSMMASPKPTTEMISNISIGL